MKLKYLLPVFLVFSFLFSCEKEKPEPKLTEINGYVQKGPYLNGTSILVTELSSDFVATGKVFSTQILDNKGTFELKDMDLNSRYVELKADGFYFNEALNKNSEAQLTLYALADLEDKNSMNVNIISTLERMRVHYLLSQGSEFSEAKKQAQSEILAIFGFEKTDMIESELLDITQAGDDNAILLAISVILQGKLSVGDLSELLANIGTDIREDGKLDSESLGSELINNAHRVHSDVVRQNLESRYESLGVNTTIPDFEKYLLYFIENTEFIHTDKIEYPLMGEFGENLLATDKTVYPGGAYSLSAVLPEEASVIVKLMGTGWSLNHNPYDRSNVGWEIIDQNGIFASGAIRDIDLQIFTWIIPEDTLSSQKPEPSIFTIEVYENGALTPDYSREVTVIEGK